jgi:dihydroneopterin aldolase
MVGTSTVAAPATGDRMRLRGITGFGYHGVYDVEREHGQRFVVDLDLSLDLAPAATTDDLATTVDYAALSAAVVANIERDPLNLIEALAARIASLCLKSPQVETVQVTVHKPDAQMPVEIADVAVSLTRSRTTQTPERSMP